MSFAKLTAVTLAIGLAGSAAFAGAVDLTGWTGAEGSGNWTIGSDHKSVFQSVNTSYPTVFHNGVSSQGKSLEGQITVETTGDNDFIGFVLGYDTGDLTSASADYILIDWKKQDQRYYGADGAAGLAISRVSGAITNTGAWGHSDASVSELQRATNLGSTGWVSNQTYDFKLTFTASLIEVFVDGTKELSINGAFEDGSFGFYNFSQASVRYAGLEEDILPPDVPLPASLPLLLGAFGGLGLLRRKRQAV